MREFYKANDWKLNQRNMEKVIKNIAIIFGKHEKDAFDRFTFPVLGRPVASYPLLAALNSEMVDAVYLSSDSQGLLLIGRNTDGVRLLEREASQRTLTEEVRFAVRTIIEDLGYVPEIVVLMLANSPCVKAVILDQALSVFEQHDGVDSVVTAMKRAEFNPMRVFKLKESNRLERHQLLDTSPEDVYFLDHRIIAIRAKTILNTTANNDYFESLLGQNTYPMIQQDGIWDIDYIWQVPIVEGWLRQNGFSEAHTPYPPRLERRIDFPRVSAGDVPAAPVDPQAAKRILITTVPFGEINPLSVRMLEDEPHVQYVINPLGRKLKEHELAELIQDFDVVIAGTEPITKKVMQAAPRLKLISRVGIGLDNVDLGAAKELGILVSYTPDPPAPAVAELTIAHMLNLLRRVPLVDRKMRSGIWRRISGERLTNMVIGIIGTGRVGGRVLRHLQGFGPKRILVNDLKPDFNLYEMCHAEHVDKETIYRESDIITLHVPLTPLTQRLITRKEIELMKPTVSLINTSRGGIVDEQDLYDALAQHRISGAAVDVFVNEPYSGNLVEIDDTILSCHMGSMTNDCRYAMELQATEEAVRFVRGERLLQLVPTEEYENCLIKG